MECLAQICTLVHNPMETPPVKFRCTVITSTLGSSVTLPQKTLSQVLSSKFHKGVIPLHLSKFQNGTDVKGSLGVHIML